MTVTVTVNVTTTTTVTVTMAGTGIGTMTTVVNYATICCIYGIRRAHLLLSNL